MPVEEFKAMRDFLLEHRTSYEAAVKGFRWPELDHFNWAIDWFDGVLAQGESASQPALRIMGDGAVTLSFAELSERSSRVANGLRRLARVQRGDHILLMLGNTVELWETMLAAMKLGAVVIPATTLLTGADLEDRLTRGRVRHVVTSMRETRKFMSLDQSVTRVVTDGILPGWHSFKDLRDGAPVFAPATRTGGDDPLLLYFTSGTTAKPKLVLHSHQSYPAGHLSTMYWLGLLPGDVHLNVSSPGWAKHAWSSFFAPWNAGACIFIANLGPFDARALLDAIAEGGVTSLCAPPTVWRMLIQQDLRSVNHRLREVCSAGEPLNPEIIEQVRVAWGLTVRDGYGQTETTAQIGNPPGQLVKPGSIGRPLPGYSIQLLDPDGHEAQEGSVNVVLDPPPVGLMCGYQHDDGTAAPLSGATYQTGDVACRDAEGYITFVGRSDDVFKSSGYRISPFELESVLIEHPAVAEAAVIGAPDPIRHSVPKAYVALARGYEAGRDTALTIFLHLRTRLAPYKRVRRIEFAELPKTISGKIRRAELKRAEEHRASVGLQSAGEFREEHFPELK